MIKKEAKFKIVGECPKCSSPLVENEQRPGKVYYSCGCFPFEDRVSLDSIFDDAVPDKFPPGTRPILRS